MGCPLLLDHINTESGMTAVLHRLGYVYKKPKVVPGKADAQAQRELLANDHRKIHENKGENDPVYFMDAGHPQHNPVLAHGWIKQPVPTNTGHKRLNINGASTLTASSPSCASTTPSTPSRRSLCSSNLSS